MELFGGALVGGTWAADLSDDVELDDCELPAGQISTRRKARTGKTEIMTLEEICSVRAERLGWTPGPEWWVDRTAKPSIEFLIEDFIESYRRESERAIERPMRHLRKLTGKGAMSTAIDEQQQTVPKRKQKQAQRGKHDPVMRPTHGRLQDLRSHNQPPIQPSDVILHVALYDSGKPAILSGEFLVLASQQLSDLRDAMRCSRDLVPLDPATRAPLQGESAQRLSSSYFLIGNTFYNDMRSTGAVDYSRAILDRLATQEDSCQQFETRMMHETCVTELRVRLNEPYLFYHADGCEHAIVFQRIRLMGEDEEDVENGDDRDADTYPRMIYRAQARLPRCRMCRDQPGRYITVNDTSAGETPCFFCDTCYDLFHFDADGKLLCSDFELHTYRDWQPRTDSE